MAFHQQMLDSKLELEKRGYLVKLPELEGSANVRASNLVEKQNAISNHFSKIAWADTILVLNLAKSGEEGYIGPNTLMEIGLAFFLKKQIVLMNEIPEDLPYTEELLAMEPTVIHGDLNKL